MPAACVNGSIQAPMAAGTRQPGTDEDELAVTKQIDHLLITTSFCTIHYYSICSRSVPATVNHGDESVRVSLSLLRLPIPGAKQGKHYCMIGPRHGEMAIVKAVPGPKSLHFMLLPHSPQHLTVALSVAYHAYYYQSYPGACTTARG